MKKDPFEPIGTVVFVPEAINKPWDCETIAVDGIIGMAYSPSSTRIQLVEHFPHDGKILAKHVTNLVIQNDQFLKLAEAIADVAAQIKGQAEKGDM
jgi:hypothetical protein